MMHMKGIIVVAASFAFIMGASTAQAGKRLTTGLSGVSDAIQCIVVNVSEEKTITLNVFAHSSTGAVVASSTGLVLPPLQGNNIFVTGLDRWCEFIVVSGGSAKHLRGSMIAIEGGVVTAIEPAREK